MVFNKKIAFYMLICVILFGVTKAYAASALPCLLQAADTPVGSEVRIDMVGDAAAYADSITAVYVKEAFAPDTAYARLAADEYRFTDGENKSLRIVARPFYEELTAGERKTYVVKLEADGYADAAVALAVLGRAPQQFILRVFAGAEATQPSLVKEYARAEMEALQAQEAQYYTLFCFMMEAPGVVKTEGVFLEDLFADAGVQFTAGDKLWLRTTDCLLDENAQKGTVQAFALAAGSLADLPQQAYYRADQEGEYTYESIYGSSRYFFPGYFRAHAAEPTLFKAGYLTHPLSLAGAQPVAPMLGITYPANFTGAMAENEQYPSRGGSLAALEAMPLTENAAYRFCFGQKMESDASGNCTVSTETTRFLTAYNVFGIDIIQGVAKDDQTPPILQPAAGEPGRITFTDDSLYTNSIRAVYLNDTLLEREEYQLTLGNLIFPESSLLPGATYRLALVATGYADAQLEFTVPAEPQSVDVNAWRRLMTGTGIVDFIYWLLMK